MFKNLPCCPKKASAGRIWPGGRILHTPDLAVPPIIDIANQGFRKATKRLGNTSVVSH